ncbi:MAG: hypothetical protein KDH96_08750 [Candidatus Riesia sp.]|nr:hypothetical protein [Candidatus Riesia sp.]
MKKLKTYESFEPEEEWLEEEDVEIGDIFVIDPKDWDSFVEFLKKNGVHEWNGIENINKPLHEPYHNKTYRGKYYILILDNRKIYTLAYWLSEKNGIFKINVRVIFDYSHTVIEEYTIDISKSKKFIPLNESFEPEEYWEEEEDTIPKELESFLKDNNCYEEYVEAASTEYSSVFRQELSVPSNLDEFYEKTDRTDWINHCFLWVNTTGGDNLWTVIHSKWISHLYHINESFEPEEEWEEKPEIPEELESFLKDNNCYEEYVEAADSEYSSTVRKSWNHPSDLDEFYEKVDRMNWISYCFKWSKTPSGDVLWSGIHSKWRRHLYRMNESFEPEEEWVDEDEIFEFDHPIHNREEIPFSEGDNIKVKWYDASPYNGVMSGQILNITDFGGGVRNTWIIIFKPLNYNFGLWISGFSKKASIELIKDVNESFEPEEEWEDYHLTTNMTLGQLPDDEKELYNKIMGFDKKRTGFVSVG